MGKAENDSNCVSVISRTDIRDIARLTKKASEQHIISAVNEDINFSSMWWLKNFMTGVANYVQKNQSELDPELVASIITLQNLKGRPFTRKDIVNGINLSFDSGLKSLEEACAKDPILKDCFGGAKIEDAIGSSNFVDFLYPQLFKEKLIQTPEDVAFIKTTLQHDPLSQEMQTETNLIGRLIGGMNLPTGELNEIQIGIETKVRKIEKGVKVLAVLASLRAARKQNLSLIENRHQIEIDRIGAQNYINKRMHLKSDHYSFVATFLSRLANRTMAYETRKMKPALNFNFFQMQLANTNLIQAENGYLIPANWGDFTVSDSKDVKLKAWPH
jgi:hypothetical protein